VIGVVDSIDVLAEELHDVDLGYGFDVVGRQHPEGWPETLASGELGARLDIAVRHLEALVGGDDAREVVDLVRIVRGAIAWFTRCADGISVTVS